MKLNLYPRNIQQLVASVLNGRGNTSVSLRHSIEAHTAHDHGAHRPEANIPPELLPYIDKISRHAYKVTDKDMEELKLAGFTEDQIFEITISASLGPALARLERGLSLLDHDQ